MILIGRIFADIFWKNKEISIILNVLMLVYLMVILCKLKIKYIPKPIFSVFIILILLLTYSFLIDISKSTLIIFGKIMGSYLLFILGIYVNEPIKNFKWIMIISSLMIMAYFLMAVFGFGYKNWGNVLTFAGTYFFKTDMALAMIIAITFVLVFCQDIKLKIIIVACAFFVIFKTNARIHLFTSLEIILLYIFRNSLIKGNLKVISYFKRWIIIGGFITAVSFGSIYIIQKFENNNKVLKLDFQNLTSESNTQGRSKIWKNVIDSYQKSEMLKKVFGTGLRQDVKTTRSFGGHHAGFNSHSSYIYALISFGYVGIFVFGIFILDVIRRILYNLKSSPTNDQKNLILMTISHIFIFLVSSVTNVTLIYQQETWFVFYFCGILYNINYFKPDNFLIKKTINESR